MSHTGLPPMQYGRIGTWDGADFVHRTRASLRTCDEAQLEKLGNDIANRCDGLTSSQYRQMIEAWAQAKRRLEMDVP